ncbi:MAG: hypothetical protein R2795_10930, partial [Saprospiraceae bacterium]
MIRLFTFLCITFFLTTLGFGQSDVTIHVSDSESTMAIVGASVELNAVVMLTDGNGDAVFTGLADGAYPFTVTSDCYDMNAGTALVAGGNVTENILLTATTSAPVFVLTSNHPIIGSWVDGNVSLTNAMNSYSYDVTEFDNIIADVAFGTYQYTFQQAGGCYPAVTGTLTVDCASIDAQSGNVVLNIVDLGTATTSAPVFVLTSNHPIIGSWVDGNVSLTNAMNSYSYDVTEFDNIIA